jgi:hypothetical protein
MAVNITLTDKGQAAPTSTVKSTLAWLGVCSSGVANTCYQFTVAGLVAASIGYGPLTEGIAAGVRISDVQQIGCKITGSVAGTKSAVAQTGTGPAITLSGTPYDTTTPRFKITTGGALGTATGRLALDGSTYGPTIDIPLQTSAMVTGTVDMTGFTWGAAGTLDTLTLKADADVGPLTTCTFAAPADASAAVSQFNAAMVAGSSSARAQIVQGRYWQTYSTTLGPSSTLVIDATSTADTVLGLSNTAATGSASTYAIPKTGITMTFPTGTYALDEEYTWTTTEPKFATADLVAALTALQQSGLAFRDIVILSSPVDGSETRAFATQLASSMSTWRAGPPKVFSVAMMGSSIGGTGPSNIALNDTDVRSAMQGQADDYVAVAHGDIYLQGTEILGSFRRPLVFALGARCAAYPVSSDPGNREQPQLEEASMLNPDGVTLARNEETATVKMQTQGFTVAKSEFGAAYFVQGVSRSTSPKFQYLAILRMGVQFARVVYTAGKRYENSSRFLNPNGTIRTADGASIKGAIQNAIDAQMADDISGRTVTVVGTNNIGVTNNLIINADAQHRGYFFTVTLNAGITDILS